MQFAEGLGADRASVKAEQPLPETKAMVDDFFDIAKAVIPARAASTTNPST